MKPRPPGSRMHLVAIMVTVSILMAGCGATTTSNTSPPASSSTTLSTTSASTSTSAPAQETTSTSSPANKLVLLAWNDLGMHCYNEDFTDLAVLPPYNTLWAQVIQPGNPPRLVTTGISLEYRFPDNTYSAGKAGLPDKSNFWQYAQKLFGLSQPLPNDTGLKGKGLSGTLDLDGDRFTAVGIPLTQYRDQDIQSKTPYPFQLAEITVRDTSGAVLAQQQVVAPVSTDMHCETCHSDSGRATAGEITPTGNVYTNILSLHDSKNADEYAELGSVPLMQRRPVLCGDCHQDNALGTPGKGDVPSLSNAVHSRHARVGIPATTEGCYSCHPGPNTRCLRDVHAQTLSFTCESCHGDLSKVGSNSDPWLTEPRCDASGCHKVTVAQDQPLYRMSKGMGGIYCEGCHDSTHALATSRENNDGLKFVALQGDAGPLHACSVCHTGGVTGTSVHTK
jgi:hypothetical protein